MAGVEDNWAKILFDTMVKEHSTFLPYDAFLTHVFCKFKIDLASETNVVKLFELFGRSVLLRMELFGTPPPQPTFSSQSSQRPFQSSSQLPPSHFSDAYYNTLTVEVLAIKTQQAPMIESQIALFNSQSMLMDHFLNINIKMDTFEATQQEILGILKTQFPPLPPPSGSNMYDQMGHGFSI